MCDKVLHNPDEELSDEDRLNNDWDLKIIKKLFKTKKEKDLFNLVYKIFRDSSIYWDLIFLKFILDITKKENIDKYNLFIKHKWLWQKSINTIITLVKDNIEELYIKKKDNTVNITKIKKKKEASFEIEKVRKLPKSSFVFDLKKEWVKKRIWYLSFREIKRNIYYIDGFSVDEKFQKQWLEDKLMEEFKIFLWDNWMWFLNDSTSNYWIESPYEKYWWNNEKFIPELVQRKVFYFWNNTKEKKVELKQVAKNFYKNN